MRKIKKNEARVEDESGAAILLLAGAGLGAWLWLRRKAQPVAPAFALVSRESQGQGQGVSQVHGVSQVFPGDFWGARRYGSDRSAFGFIF